MNEILQRKINELETAKDYECWYLVKQETCFEGLCYKVKYLQQFKENSEGLNLENFIKKAVLELKKEKPTVKVSDTHRALRVAAFFGLITMKSTSYNDAEITPTFNEITNRCDGEYEKTELYSDIIQRQIEKMFISSSIDEQYTGVRQSFRLYPIMLLYKVLVELGRATGDYSITINEYRYLVATTKVFQDFLNTLLLIKLLREDPSVNSNLEKFKGKFDNRLIQALKQLPTLVIDKEKIKIHEDKIIEVSDKVHIFEKNPEVFNTENYLKFLASTKSLFELAIFESEDQSLETDVEYVDIESFANFEKYPHNRIVFGAPGTGKSNKLKQDSKDLLKDGGALERVTFYPDYSYSQFVGTYKPTTDDNGEISYEFVPGPFMRVYVNAIKNPDKPYLLLIEEINRAKVASVFGDVFQLLDRDEDGLSEYEVQTSEDVKKHLMKELGDRSMKWDHMKIPSNMFIWATMNSADQGVFPMDTAFKRRWNFDYLGINENEDKLHCKLITVGRGDFAKDINWNQLRRAINEKLSKDYKLNEDKLMGPFFLAKSVVENDNSEEFVKSFKNKVIMYLYEDAAKQHKSKLFSGCDDMRYSSVCGAFDEKGIGIFGADFIDLYNQQEG